MEQAMDKLNTLIESVYQTTTDESLWTEVLQSLADYFNSTQLGFFRQGTNNTPSRFNMTGIDDAYIQSYDAYYSQLNPWFSIPGFMHPGKILSDRSLEAFYQNKDAFTHSEIYNDWYGPQDSRHAIGGTIVDNAGSPLNFTSLRPKQAGYYSDTEVRDFKIISRHVLRAIEIGEKFTLLSKHQEAADTLLDKLKIGICFVDSNLNIEFKNAHAARLLGERDCLFEKNGKFVYRQRSPHEKLEVTLLRAIHFKKTFNLLVKRRQKSPVTLTLMPISTNQRIFGLPSDQVLIVMTIADNEHLSDVALIKMRWQLTNVEAEFARHLLTGKNCAQIAEEMELTKNTAQWYAKQLINKLGVHRQAEVIVKMLSDLSLKINYAE
ncbi:MAG: DNA-binding CsgD family transcriptional regulator [Oleiphilaceae bacterium]